MTSTPFLTALLRSRLPLSCLLLAATASFGCGGGGSSSATTTPDASPLQNLFDVPIVGIGSDAVANFNDGDALFEVILREADGLGPLYTRQSCGSCHDDEDGLRGPGSAQKMSEVEADGLTPSTDQSELPWGPTVHPFVVAP